MVKKQEVYMNDIQDFRKNYLAILKSSKLKQTKKKELFQTILCQMDEIFKIRTSEMEKYNTDNFDAITLYLEISATLKAQQENN